MIIVSIVTTNCDARYDMSSSEWCYSLDNDIFELSTCVTMLHNMCTFARLQVALHCDLAHLHFLFLVASYFVCYCLVIGYLEGNDSVHVPTTTCCYGTLI